ncbi:hypothetical protein NUH16_003660 [Penicillium rubens]|nr:hypothetical protein NUH16_003660 [Penicillium rubens]
MAACMMIDRDLARLLPTADPSTPETESLDKATETMIVMIIAVELRARLLTEAGTRTKTATERVIEVRAAIEAELVALVEASPVSREVMMDGLPVDMEEEHVSHEIQWLD